MNIKEFCLEWAKYHHVSFLLKDRELSHEEAFSETGLMPSIAKRADRLCALTLGYGIGVSFEDTEASTLGVSVSFDELTPDLIRFLCVMDILDELKKTAENATGNVVLDELLYD